MEISKPIRTRAAISKAMAHLDDDERKLVNEAVGDVIRVFGLTRAMTNTPATDNGPDRMSAIINELLEIEKKWAQD